jgi:peptide methionine sulfoxide reductase MsrB
MTSKHPKELPMRHCFNCGADLGRYADHDPLDTCGERECIAAANDARAQEREDEREALDRYEFGRY